MVVAREVEDAVDEQAIHLFGEREAALGSLARGGVERDHHVAERWRYVGELAFPQREGQHVGGTVPAAVVAVQRVDLAVTDQPQAELVRAEPERVKNDLRLLGDPLPADPLRGNRS